MGGGAAGGWFTGFIHLCSNVGAKSNPLTDGREADAGFRYAKAAGIQRTEQTPHLADRKQAEQAVECEQTSHPGDGEHASPFADGEKIAFTEINEKLDPSASADASASASGPPTISVPYIFVKNADGSDKVRLVDSPAGGPAW